MQQRDYLKDQIDQMSAALAALLSELVLGKATTPVSELIEPTKKALQENLDLDLDEIIDLQPPMLHKYFERKNFGAPQYELLALLLEELGSIETVDVTIFRKAAQLLELADAKAEAQSMRRVEAKARINQKLSSLNNGIDA